MDISKEERIKKENAKLKGIFKNISKDKMKLVEVLIQNASFMAVTLEDLQENINEYGATFTSTNGNGFEVFMSNPAQTNYNTLVNRYATVIKQLTDLLPDSKSDQVGKAGEALAKFVAQGKTKPIR